MASKRRPPMRDRFAALWDRLNPSEPSSAYLVKFMAVALAMFVVALVIGRLGAG